MADDKQALDAFFKKKKKKTFSFKKKATPTATSADSASGSQGADTPSAAKPADTVEAQDDGWVETEEDKPVIKVTGTVADLGDAVESDAGEEMAETIQREEVKTAFRSILRKTKKKKPQEEAVDIAQVTSWTDRIRLREAKSRRPQITSDAHFPALGEPAPTRPMPTVQAPAGVSVSNCWNTLADDDDEEEEATEEAAAAAAEAKPAEAEAEAEPDTSKFKGLKKKKKKKVVIDDEDDE